MKKTFFASIFAVCLALPGFIQAAHTNFPSGVGVGTSFAGTYMALTGTAITEVDIPIGSWMNGEYTPLSSPAQTNNAGIGSNVSSAAATFAALSGEFISLTAQVRIPANFTSTPVLVGWFTTSASDVACSVTANVVVNTVGSALSNVPTADTAVFIPTASATVLTEVEIADNMTLYPDRFMTFLIERTGGTTATLYLHRLFLRYRPAYVMP